MKRLLTLLLLLLIPGAVWCSTTNLTGTFKDAQGNGINGALVLVLAVPGQDVDAQVRVDPRPVSCTIINGVLTNCPAVNDLGPTHFQPNGDYYIGRVYDTSGALLEQGNFVITGVTFNIGAAPPTSITTSNISYLTPAAVNGTNIWTSPQVFQGGVTMTSGQNNINLYSLDGIIFIDGIKYPTLSAGVGACPAGGCWIIDNFPETFTADPYAGSSGKQIVTTFGAAVWTVNYTPAAGSGGINIQAAQRIVGTGRVNGSTSGTIFRAALALGANPVVKLAGTQGTRIENATIDCNSVVGSTGLYATDINEQGGGFNLAITNCPNFGINVDATAFTVIPAQNYTFRDIEIFPQSAGSGSTVAMQLKGNGGGGPAEIVNVTANGASGHVIQASILATNWNQGTLRNIHGEFTTNVFQIPATGVSGFMIDNISGSGTDTNVININAAATTNSFMIRNISTSGGAINSVVDSPRGITLTDTVITWYGIGTGSINNQAILSSSPNLPNLFIPNVGFLGGITVGSGASLVAKISYLNTGSITPTIVAANSCSEQTFTVTGLVANNGNLSAISPPGAPGQLAGPIARISANNTLAMNWCNPTGAGVTPPAGTYRFVYFQ